MATYHLYAPGRRRPPKYGTSEAADAHHLNIFQRGFQLGLRKHQYCNILEALQLIQRCASVKCSLENPMLLHPHPCISRHAAMVRCAAMDGFSDTLR